MKKLLEVKNLTVKLGTEKIIDNLSFEITEGEILTILGPNGAGKTVLLRALLGFFSHEGEINWLEKPTIGYLPQGLNQLLLSDLPLTIYDFFTLKTKHSSKEEVVKFLKLVGLDGKVLYKKAGNLSGGEFQRMLIAWVLISSPEIIFLDEPTTSIDIGGGETIFSLLQHIKQEQNLTIIIVTHDLNIVYGYSNNVLCLSRKAHFCFGKPREILHKETLEEMFGQHIKMYGHNK